MSTDSLHFAGVVLITVPAIAFGGVRLLRMIFRREPGYLDNPVRQNLWRAGHAHAGVLLILSLVALLLVDEAELSSSWKQVVRASIPAAAILLPVAYFLSVVRVDVERPNRLINLAYVGGVSLAIGTVTLGVGLLRAA